MKILILATALTGLTLLSCGSKNTFISGSWTIDNLNSSDTSVNVEKLLATSLVSHYAPKNILTFSSGSTIILNDPSNKELDKGSYSLKDADVNLSLKFPSDKMESEYKIEDRTDSTMKLFSTDNGETVHISLTRLGN